MAIGITRLKRDLEWLLRDTVRCLAMVGAFPAVLVDMVVVIRYKAAMVALQVLVDMLLMARLVITAATRVDKSTYSDTAVSLVLLRDVLHFFNVGCGKLLATMSLLATTGVLVLTSSGLEYIRSSSHGLHVLSLPL